MLPSNIDVTKQITKPGSIKPVLLQWRQESGEYSQWRKLTAKVAVKEIFFFFFFGFYFQSRKFMRLVDKVLCNLVPFVQF